MQNTKLGCIAVFLFAATLAAAGQPHYQMGRAYRYEPESVGNLGIIAFSNGFIIDTRTGGTDIPPLLRATPEAALSIIQFRGPVQAGWRRRLARAGIETFGYLPPYAVMARLDAAGRERARGFEFVRWVGPFHPGAKLEGALIGVTGELELDLLLTPGGDEAAVLARVAELGGFVEHVSRSAFGTVARFRLDGARLAELAALDDVLWVQAWTEPDICNNSVQWVIQTGWKSTAPPDTSTLARNTWRNGVRGQGLVLSTTDTGLNTGHDMFRDPALGITPPGIWPGHRKVVAFKLYQGAHAGEAPRHGSHVNGTVAGDDSVTGGTSYYDGMSIKARLYFVDVSNSSGSFVIGSDLTALWDTVYLGRGLPDSLRPIVQHSGSWGWSNSQGTYLLMDASTDAYCWAHKDFLNIMAAGNESSTRRLRNPGIAKNVLTVGATQNGTSSNLIASFSSRGPTQDNRIKPNVMAPGVSLWSARMYPETNTYEQLSGTSMATPAVNGAVGLMRCYLEQGYYPTGAPVTGDRIDYISAALLRSMAMVSADPNVGSYTIPSFDIGWGRVDAESVLYFTGDARKLIIRDDTAGVGTGEYKELQFQVNSAMPLRVSLAWTDTAAAANANPTIVNNLDLELTAPGGTRYRGNIYSGGQSVANPTTWDTLNVEECARINSPQTGLWTLRVYGQNVATAQKQSFAWTMTGDVSTAAKDVGCVRLIAPAGVVDSGTVVVPACSVYNYGTAAETYAVRMKIGTGYDTVAMVTSHLPGTRRYLAFPGWTATARGSFGVSCSTELAGDQVAANNRQTGTVTVAVKDVGCVRLIAPAGVVDSGTVVVPACSVYNYGTAAETYAVRMKVGTG
ncbi:MAG: S8 family serine peptidase, partial [bacterium]